MPEKDLRHPEIRKLDERLEDVGVFDDLDFVLFFKSLQDLYGIRLEKETAKILEVGSGRGKLLGSLQKEDYLVVGVEPRKRPEHVRESLPVLHMKIEDLPGIHAGQYDLVIADSVIDPKIYDQVPEKIVSAMFRALRPGGILLYGMKGESKLPDLVAALGLGKLLEIREDGLDKAYVFQKA